MLPVAVLMDDETDVVVVVAVTAPSCSDCSFLKYASRKDDVVIGLLVGLALGPVVGDAC